MRFCKLWALLLILVITLELPNVTNAQQNQDEGLEFEENLRIPSLKDKYKGGVISAQLALGKRLISKGFVVETIQDGTILIVSVPSNKIFNANEIVISHSVELSKLRDNIPNPRCYKFLLAMHCDDSGNELYKDNITTDRVISIYDWFSEYAKNFDVIPYAMADTEPIVPNNSMLNRSKNRRLEIYIIPNELMIQHIKDNY